MAKVTYNKDGTPRKQGSGRKKGSVSLIAVKLGDLISAGFTNDDTVIVGRKWHDEKFGQVKEVDNSLQPSHTPSVAADAVQEKIAYKLTTFD